MNELSPILATAKASPPALRIAVGIVGLGYVGLPLAVYMAHQFRRVGKPVTLFSPNMLAVAVM